MSLVIEGEHLHRLCLMCNPIGYCIYAFIQWNIWIEQKNTCTKCSSGTIYQSSVSGSDCCCLSQFSNFSAISFNLKGGGYGFFLKKYSDSQCCWKKYSDFGGGKKK
jgi:hypothetical protein